MKKFIFFRMLPQAHLALFSVLFIGFLTSCEKEVIPPSLLNSESLQLELKKPKDNSAEKTNTFYGPTQHHGNGVVRAFVTMDHNRVPTAIGLMISEKAMEKLPKTHTNLSFQLPNKAQGLSFNHIDLGWNPNGHEPEHLYDVPHFDIHFYMITEEEKMMINNPGLAEVLPDAQFWPETYFPTPEYVPMMGKHWLSSEAGEINGEVFDQTFIFGSYNGEFIFYEPMITVDYFKQKTSMEYEIYQPREFQKPGYYYPTKYSINYDSTKKVYTVILSGMVLRDI